MLRQAYLDGWHGLVLQAVETADEWSSWPHGLEYQTVATQRLVHRVTKHQEDTLYPVAFRTAT